MKQKRGQPPKGKNKLIVTSFRVLPSKKENFRKKVNSIIHEFR